VAAVLVNGGHVMAEQVSGWLKFASIVLIFAGIMRVLDSIWAFRYKGALPENLDSGIFGTNLKTYGVVYLVVGALLILTGIYVMMRRQFFRWVGIAAGVIGGLSGAVWLPYYPVWSLVYVGLAVLVVYALVTEGGREPGGPSTSGVRDAIRQELQRDA
jgi:hypothetical protein